jgi:hypothetical protein
MKIILILLCLSFFESFENTGFFHVPVALLKAPKHKSILYYIKMPSKRGHLICFQNIKLTVKNGLYYLLKIVLIKFQILNS